jgi:hypothetical protein
MCKFFTVALKFKKKRQFANAMVSTKEATVCECDGEHGEHDVVLTITFANFSSINLVSIFRCSSSTTNPVYTRRVNSLVSVCSLSSHRHSYIHL